NSPASGQKTENGNGGFDYWVVKLSNAGKIQWDKTIGGTEDEYLWSLEEIGRNNYLLSGASFSGISGDKTDSSRGLGDFWLVELQYKTGSPGVIVSEKIKENISAQTLTVFSVYPNPVKNILHIQAPGKITFTVTNQQGKVLITKTINNNGEINVSQLAAGLYYLKNQTTGETQKIIITK
ncbi:MAG: T9SS type A sorting domain-containing protein, partial [Panacibacter sp.]